MSDLGRKRTCAPFLFAFLQHPSCGLCRQMSRPCICFRPCPDQGAPTWPAICRRAPRALRSQLSKLSRPWRRDRFRLRLRSMRRLTLLLLSPFVVAAATPSPAGTYQIHQMEMAGGLELQPGGHFRYAFTYGAVDEEAEGDWSFDGKAVHLTSKPMPNEPTFDLVRDTPAPKCTLSLSIDWGKFSWSSAPDVLVAYADAPR